MTQLKRKKSVVPPLIPLNANTNSTNVSNNSSPPPLEHGYNTRSKQNKENIQSLNTKPRKRSKKITLKRRKKSIYSSPSVPPLELLPEDTETEIEPIPMLDDNIMETETINNIPQKSQSIVIEEEVIESGQISNTNIHPIPIQSNPESNDINMNLMSPNMNIPQIPNIPTINSMDVDLSQQCLPCPTPPKNPNPASNPTECIPVPTQSQNTSTTTTNPNPNSLDNNQYVLAPNGRLLESESEWNQRPKVTYTANGDMVFRPLRMKCTHCDEAYTKTHDLYAHIRTHQHHTKCPHCGKILTCMATFVYHVRTHTAEKPYYCPCDGCDFKNAVKYNLKVHLACIRHGGKKNLKKYAKVLDLDVCEKSLRKRKDNSVHELGSRRSKKRRKLNSNNSHHSQHRNSSFNNSMNNMVVPHSSNYGVSNMLDYGVSAYNYGNIGYNPHTPVKQEECDQYAAAQLLFQLSAMPPVFDPMQMNLDWSVNNNQDQRGNDPTTGNVNQNTGQIQLELNGNVIKTEDDNQDGNNNNNMQVMQQSQQLDQYLLKPEQYYHDPLYYYYYQNQLAANLEASVAGQKPQLLPAPPMMPTDTKASTQIPKEEFKDEGSDILKSSSASSIVPKKEPKYSDYHMISLPETPVISHRNISNENNHNVDYNNLVNQQLLLPYLNYPYYLTPNTANVNDINNMNNYADQNQNNQDLTPRNGDKSSKLDMPPLPIQFVEGQVNGFEINK